MEDTATIETYEAKFTKTSYATSFANRISEAGWNVEGEVAQKGRTVTWAAKSADHRQYLLDLLETVGYYGSPPIGPQSTLKRY